MSNQLSQKEQGVVKTVLDRFNHQRLPALIKLKKHVDNGGVLSDVDVRLLEDSISEAKDGERYAGKHPEFKKLIAEVSSLYQDITTTALENQKLKK